MAWLVVVSLTADADAIFPIASFWSYFFAWPLSDGLFRMPAVSPIFLRRGCLAAKLAATAIVLPTHVQATIANGVLSVEGEQAF